MPSKLLGEFCDTNINLNICRREQTVSVHEAEILNSGMRHFARHIRAVQNICLIRINISDFKQLTEEYAVWQCGSKSRLNTVQSSKFQFKEAIKSRFSMR